MPLIERKNFSPTSFLGIWEVTESLEELKGAYQLSEMETQVFNAFSHPFRKTQWLATRLLLDELLPGTRIVYDENGKPWADKKELHLSISHSAAFIALMVDERPCGVDIEIVRDKIDRIAPRFLCEEELAAARMAPATERMHVYWCVKEAIYKVYGKKNVSLRSDIFVETVTDVQSGTVSASLRYNDDWRKKEVSYTRFRNCMMAWVSAR